jgi:hypothetical protein
MLPVNAVGPLAAGEHRRVEGQMKRQIERVGLRLARLCRDCREIYPALRKLLDDVGALAGIRPAGALFVLAGAECLHFRGGVVAAHSQDGPRVRCFDFQRPHGRENSGASGGCKGGNCDRRIAGTRSAGTSAPPLTGGLEIRILVLGSTRAI